MEVTVRHLYELAQKLSPKERKRLAQRLLRDLEKVKKTRQKVGRKAKAPSPSQDPLADDPWFAELREIQKRAEEVLGLHSVEDIMSWLRGQPWGFDK